MSSACKTELSYASATGTQSSERYCVAKPCRHLQSLEVTRCGTSNQCSSSWRMCVRPWANFRVPVMTRTAALTIRCGVSRSSRRGSEQFVAVSIRLVTNAWTSVAALSRSSESRTRRSWHSWKITLRWLSLGASDVGGPVQRGRRAYAQRWQLSPWTIPASKSDHEGVRNLRCYCVPNSGPH